MEDVSVLIAKSQSGDKEAREVLIEKNLGLGAPYCETLCGKRM